MPSTNANLRLPPASPSPLAVNGDVANMSRSQSQNFPANGLAGPAISIPMSHSVNDNLAANATTPTGAGPNAFSRYDESASKSPKSNRAHCIPHKWEARRNKHLTRCYSCGRPISFMSSCQRCTVCKSRVHAECRRNVGNNCGLTAKHLRACIEHMVTSGTHDDWVETGSTPQEMIEPLRPASRGDLAESSSSNSANSSTPSTPAWTLRNPSGMATLHPSIAEMAPKTAPLVITSSPSIASDSLFTFPDSAPRVPSIVLPSSTDDNMNKNSIGVDSDHTLLPFGSGDESDQNTLASDMDAGMSDDGRVHKWDRRAWSKGTIRDKSSTTLKEDLVIPFDKVTIARSIGRGRFGEVFACDHFGEAAIKWINVDHTDTPDNHFLKFLEDVREVKLARHDRILAFFGCTMDKNTNMMGIVIDYCEGKPLHTILHQRDTYYARLDFQKVVRLASQICQGMSYLHNRKLLHKDLRTKNIFITAKNNVVITDYSLFTIKMLAKPSRNRTIITPDHWLCYLAPEMVHSLSADLKTFPFSEQSDVYAFGTIFYEFIAYDFPFTKQHPDSIIWQVGVGIKPPLGNLNVCREAKVVLVRCWMHKPEDRPSFSEILKMVERLPMKHLCRSPSNPL
uniref:Protein kinase domain-containing protein n=1 Tax=Panagrellus redivivus TaxID=6233 RepID=A0A7E4VLJ6_PANRE